MRGCKALGRISGQTQEEMTELSIQLVAHLRNMKEDNSDDDNNKKKG